MRLNEPGRRRILFVDDEPKLLDGLRRMLFPRRKEWDMVFAGGAQEALEALTLEPFEVLVTDMRMPGMDGADLLDQVVKLYPEIVRLVLSGQWEPEISIRSAKTAHQYLTKPCNAETLKKTLDRAFELRRQLKGRRLQRLVSGMTTLPSLPVSYRRLIATLESPLISIGQIGDVIASDIAMTAKVLQLANSAFFGVARRMSDPAEATRYLGLDTIRALVRRNVFLEFTGPESACRILTEIHQRSRHRTPCLASLLDDVGKLILLNNEPEIYEDAMTLAANEKLELGAVEREVFGASHTEIGSYLLWLWGLSDAGRRADSEKIVAAGAGYQSAVSIRGEK